MTEILIFADNKPPRLLRVSEYREKIRYFYSDGEIKCMSVVMFFATFMSGKTGVVLYAADKSVTREEVLAAQDALIS